MRGFALGRDGRIARAFVASSVLAAQPVLQATQNASLMNAFEFPLCEYVQ